MTTEQQDLVTALHGLAERTPATRVPLEQLLQRGHRARRVRAVGFSGAALTAVAVVAAATTGGLWAGGPPAAGSDRHGDAAVAAAEPANIRLASAVRATAQTTFRMRTTFSDQGGSDTMIGAYDPAGHRGYQRYEGADGFALEMRVIGADCYVSVAGADGRISWNRLSAGCTGFQRYGPAGGVSAELSADPGELLRALAGAGAVTHVGRSGSGPAAVDRYSFSLPARSDGPEVGDPITGTVEIGAESGLISKIAYQGTRRTYVDGDKKIAIPGRYTVVTLFSDYGAPVRVERPVVR